MPGLQHSVTIAAAPERVWRLLVDVEGWPSRIPTVDLVERLDAGPLAVGSRTRLRLPRLPEGVWTVTELDEGRSFTWESALEVIGEAVEGGAPGVPVVLAGHSLGGYLALAWAADHPRRLAGLGLLGASAVPAGPGAALYRA